MATDRQPEAWRGRLIAVCLALICLCLVVCVGSAGLGAAWLEVPALNEHADFVYACVGANLHGRFRVGIGWDANLGGMGTLMIALPDSICGYWPLPPHVGTYGTWIFQP